MKKTMTALILAGLLLATGCSSANARGSAPRQSIPESSRQEETMTTEAPTDATEETSASEEATPEEEEENNPLKDLIKNQYEDLEITAAVLLRRAILPGSSIPVTVAITNNGDKTIFYTQGSGVFETPQALRTQFDGLQVVLPKDHLGIATMDFVTKELAPGESLEFVVNVLAIEPNEQFASYTYETYNEDEIYIADMEWPDLQEKYPDLTAAAAGSYTGTVNFLYTLPAEDGAADPFSGATGYAQAEVTIGVTE